MADKPDATQRTPLSSSSSHAGGTQALSVTVEEEPGFGADAGSVPEEAHSAAEARPPSDEIENDPTVILPENVAAAWEERHIQSDDAIEPVQPQIEPYTAETTADELPDGYAASDVFLDERRAYFAGDTADDSFEDAAGSALDGRDNAAAGKGDVSAEVMQSPVDMNEAAASERAVSVEETITDHVAEPENVVETIAHDAAFSAPRASDAAGYMTDADVAAERTVSDAMEPPEPNSVAVMADASGEEPSAPVVKQTDVAEAAFTSEAAGPADEDALHANGTAPANESYEASYVSAEDARLHKEAEREKALAVFEQMTQDFRAMMEDARNDATKVGVKLMEFAQANLKNNADLARDYAGARSVPEIVNVHAAYFKRQMELLNRQAEELRNLTSEIASKKTEKLQTRTKMS